MSFINLENKFSSESLLFSIPVHEKIDIIRNQVENILNNNPNCKIIIHANKSFSDFDKKHIYYNNVYVNSNKINYEWGSGLLNIHSNNFLEALKLNIDFDYFVLISSNEMFIKKGTIDYINNVKNGIQLIEYNENISWHNFNKKYNDLINNKNIIELLNYLNLKKLVGGQSEGQFFEKKIFQDIIDIFLKFFKNVETNFETEELIIQTIFFSLNKEHGDPITLQNYSNKLTFDNNFIKRLLNNTIIPNNIIEGNLLSPHANKTSENIFSIKRVDRSFNPLRKYLSKKGFLLNKDSYIPNTNYYSNNSSIKINNDKNIIFKKNNKYNEEFQWFGFSLNKNTYILKFEFRINKFVNEFYDIGIKIHKPYEYIISNIFHQNLVGMNKKIILPIILDNKQEIIFIFDNIKKNINFNIFNLSINKFDINIFKKKKLILFFHDNYNNYNNELFNYLNIKKELIEPLNELYDVFIFISLKKDNTNNINIIKNLNPYKVIYNDYESINNILLELLITSNKFLENSKIELCMVFPINIILKKNIKNIPFFINKINFLSYIFINEDNLNYNYNVLIFDYRFYNFIINLLKNYININSLLSNFNRYINDNIKIDDINILIKDNLTLYDENEYFKYNNQIYLLNNIKNNEGFIYDNQLDNYIVRSNLNSYFYKVNNNHYYYYKKSYNKISLFNWCGISFKTTNKETKNININISFNIKINTNINHNQTVGIKTHHPEIIHKNWLKKCKLYEYVKINIETVIEQKNQEIILYFDEYLDEIEFYIKDFIVEYKLQSL